MELSVLGRVFLFVLVFVVFFFPCRLSQHISVFRWVLPVPLHCALGLTGAHGSQKQFEALLSDGCIYLF